MTQTLSTSDSRSLTNQTLPQLGDAVEELLLRLPQDLEGVAVFREPVFKRGDCDSGLYGLLLDISCNRLGKVVAAHLEAGSREMGHLVQTAATRLEEIDALLAKTAAPDHTAFVRMINADTAKKLNAITTGLDTALKEIEARYENDTGRKLQLAPVAMCDLRKYTAEAQAEVTEWQQMLAQRAERAKGASVRHLK